MKSALRFPAPRRSNVEVMCDILNVIGQGIEKPTLIAYRSNLSWSVLMRHLEAMAKRGLVEKRRENKRWLYNLTPRGRDLLRLYRSVRRGLGVSEEAPQTPFTQQVELRIAVPS